MASKPHDLIKMAEAQDVTVKHLIITTLEQFSTVAAAARSLGITPAALRYHLHKRNLHTEIKITVKAKKSA